MLDQLSYWIPQQDGWLPKWQLFIAVTAVFNTVQNFATLKLTRRIYNNVPPATVTSLQARTFGAWTLASAVVRFYAAYHINDKSVYDMALFTYLIAFGHFSSEFLIFRTAKLNPGLLSTFAVASASLVWMISQYDFYLAYAPLLSSFWHGNPRWRRWGRVISPQKAPI